MGSAGGPGGKGGCFFENPVLSQTRTRTQNPAMSSEGAIGLVRGYEELINSASNNNLYCGVDYFHISRRDLEQGTWALDSLRFPMNSLFSLKTHLSVKTPGTPIHESRSPNVSVINA